MAAFPSIRAEYQTTNASNWACTSPVVVISGIMADGTGDYEVFGWIRHSTDTLSPNEPKPKKEPRAAKMRRLTRAAIRRNRLNGMPPMSTKDSRPHPRFEGRALSLSERWRLMQP